MTPARRATRGELYALAVAMGGDGDIVARAEVAILDDMGEFANERVAVAIFPNGSLKTFTIVQCMDGEKATRVAA